MEMLKISEAGTRVLQPSNNISCPVCGETMLEVERLSEGNHLFVWFECGKKDCSGQWLQKWPRYSASEKLSLSAT